MKKMLSLFVAVVLFLIFSFVQRITSFRLTQRRCVEAIHYKFFSMGKSLNMARNVCLAKENVNRKMEFIILRITPPFNILILRLSQL